MSDNSMRIYAMSLAGKVFCFLFFFFFLQGNRFYDEFMPGANKGVYQDRNIVKLLLLTN